MALPPLPPPPGPPPHLDAEVEALAKDAKEIMDKGGAEVAGPIGVEGEDLEAWAIGMLEMLTPGHQDICRQVQEKGLGVCARCRWTHGCSACSFPKAVRYWRNQEAKGELGEGYVGKGRGRAKGGGRGRGRGRPKAAAGTYKAG